MADYHLDRLGWTFHVVGLAIFLWAVFDTERFLRLLSYNRRTQFSRFELLVIRVPGTICILGISWELLHGWLHAP
jgi:hypothetical protein